MNEVYKTAVIADYFTRDELVKKIGLIENYWYDVVIKELIDNALDAIEPLNNKRLNIIQNNEGLSIFDNGNGIPYDTVKDIYNFEFYISKNRHYITASRGKQGNGLKTIIGICFVKKWRLLWHTSEGVVLEARIDADSVKDGILNIEFVETDSTDKCGIEIIGFQYPYDMIYGDKGYKEFVDRYSMCNPDVLFILDFHGDSYSKIPTKNSVDKSKNLSLSFYDYDTYKRFVRDTQDGNKTYKQFLGEYFGTRIKNESQIKSKIKDIDFSSMEFIDDFLNLKSVQQSKKYTLLKNQMIGLGNSIQTTLIMDSEESDINITDKTIPCIIEFSVRKNMLKADADKNNRRVQIQCYVNNTVTYKDAESICFSYDKYKIGTVTEYAYNLTTLLRHYTNFSFSFHIISPYFKFMDAGKTEIDISSCFDDLLEKLNKAIGKENRLFNSLSSDDKKPDNRAIMREHITEAFNLASNNGKYAITARQIWYKMREIAPFEEKDSTYSDFTQNILTEWIDANPDWEDKVNFSDRGNFYIDGRQLGLGTANVRNFINNTGKAENIFNCYGGFTNNMHIEADFNLEYKYDKVLYIEKTGFDAIFKAEKIGEKYNMIIVSGQGFSTRAAKTLLYQFQNMGLKLYCMHDLDISGVFILNSFKIPNKKFKQEIIIEDLGVTIEDVEKYNIHPEEVSLKKGEYKKMTSLPYDYQQFFNAGNDKCHRVELNAFTTEQILEILDRKLSNINNLPTISLENALNVDHDTIKQTAFMRVMADKYKEQLASIYVPIDLSEYNGRYTVATAKKEIPAIENQLVAQYETAIQKELNIWI